MPVDLVRDAAVDVLLRVFERKVFLDTSLDKTLHRKPMSDRGRRFLTQVVYGTVRHLRLCDHALGGICRQPLEELPLPILTILRMAVFQSLFLQTVTPPAMVHTSVELAKRRGHAGTARLVNAILRRAPQTLDEVRLPDAEKNFPRHLAIKYSMPDWLVGSWLEQFGKEQTEALCAASNVQAPVTLRTNTLKTTVDELAERLQRAEVQTRKETAVPQALTVVSGEPPLKTKVFQQGMFLVQDAASMLPAHLLEPLPGETILDVCAAPGGKTTHIAQLADDKAAVIANDPHRFRLRRVVDNCERLGIVNVFPVCSNGGQAAYAGVFNRVLVDAPCSGLGTLRRHPDLKWRMTAESIVKMGQQQRALLRSAIGLCKNGGVIVYSVCTFTREETTDVIQAVLDDGQVTLEPGPEFMHQWQTGPGQYQTLPAGAGLDGFFLTRFRKRS